MRKILHLKKAKSYPIRSVSEVKDNEKRSPSNMEDDKGENLLKEEENNLVEGKIDRE